MHQCSMGGDEESDLLIAQMGNYFGVLFFVFFLITAICLLFFKFE